jgi:ABC-type sugar transport system substrate-binding protein
MLKLTLSRESPNLRRILNGNRGEDPQKMKRWTIAFAALAAFGLVAPSIIDVASAADKKYTIALIPGLTTDPFYITMHKGAEAAAKALGVDLIFQGAPNFNPVTQIPVLNAVIARQPSAILIAPTGKVELIEPLKKASDAGIPVLTVDTFIGNGRYQTGSGDADFPLSYIASDNILGGENRCACSGEGDWRQRKGLCLQHDAQRVDNRSA